MSKSRRTSPALVAALAAALIGGAPGPAFGHAGETHAAPGDHAHKAPHGGHVVTVKQYHYELVPNGAKGFKIYLMDQKLKELPLNGVTGKAIVQLDGKQQTLTLMNMGDYLHGSIDPTKANRIVVVVTLSIGGKPFSGRFTHSKTEKAPAH